MPGDVEISVLHFKFQGEVRHWTEIGFDEIRSARPHVILRYLVTWEDVMAEANFALGLHGHEPKKGPDDKSTYNANPSDFVPHHNYLLLLSWLQVHDAGTISIVEQ